MHLNICIYPFNGIGNNSHQVRKQIFAQKRTHKQKKPTKKLMKKEPKTTSQKKQTNKNKIIINNALFSNTIDKTFTILHINTKKG